MWMMLFIYKKAPAFCYGECFLKVSRVSKVAGVLEVSEVTEVPEV